MGRFARPLTVTAVVVIAAVVVVVVVVAAVAAVLSCLDLAYNFMISFFLPSRPSLPPSANIRLPRRASQGISRMLATEKETRLLSDLDIKAHHIIHDPKTGRGIEPFAYGICVVWVVGG